MTVSEYKYWILIDSLFCVYHLEIFREKKHISIHFTISNGLYTGNLKVLGKTFYKVVYLNIESTQIIESNYSVICYMLINSGI